MKVLLLLLLLFGCYDQESKVENISIGKMDDYYFENDLILKSIDEAFSYSSYYIKYKEDESDYWQTPEETYKLKTGDCEDVALLFMYFCRNNFDIDCQLVNVGRGDGDHVLVYLPSEKLYYEIVKYFKMDCINPGWEINWICSYGEAMWMANYYHDNVGKYY